jgi:hypothetical protein
MNKRRNNVKPTKLQRKTLEILKENPDMPLGKAMISAGYAENSSLKPKQNFTERKGLSIAVEEFKDILREKGITERKLAEKQAEWLDAKKVVSARVIFTKDSPTSQADGELPPANARTDDFIEVPDYQTQLKAGEMIREDFGIKQVGTPININFNKIANNQKQEYGI